jgi:predicted NAD/FAD-binding protein
LVPKKWSKQLSQAPEQRQKIAIVGGGVAGIVAAYLLQKKHEIVLFESNDYLGGHTHTIEISDGPDAGTAVDTGFIVLNNQTYPFFMKFLSQLGVATRVSEMSFGFQCRQTGLVYAGTNLNGLFAQKRNLVSGSFLRFLLEIARFCRNAGKDLKEGSIPAITLGEYVAKEQYSKQMIDNYLIPMAAAIWSTPAMKVNEFPAEPFLRFFSNHGLLSFRHRPIWQTVTGGSFSYVKAFEASFRGQIYLTSAVKQIIRHPQKVEVKLSEGKSLDFDQVVVATHADQALQLLGDPSDDEKKCLSPWMYSNNHTVLHVDKELLPKQKSAWAAWNFTRDGVDHQEQPVYVTYYMNRLQGLQTKRDYCVTLNRKEPFKPGTVITEMVYQHPLYTFDAMRTQSRLPVLNGQRRTFFCGSYFGYGFHEDAVKSGVKVAENFGITL